MAKGHDRATYEMWTYSSLSALIGALAGVTFGWWVIPLFVIGVLYYAWRSITHG